EIDSLSRAYEDQVGRRVRRNNRRSYKFKNKYRGQDYAWMVVSSIKRFQFNYNQTNGAIIPGILSEPNFFGFGDDGSPGAGFIYGTEFDIKRKLIESGNDWVTRSEQLLEPYVVTRGTNFTASSIIEPFPKLRIDLNAKRTSTFRSSETAFNLRTPENPNINTYVDRYETLNSSNIAISTAFSDPDQLYQNFLENAQVISQRLGTANGMAPGPDGYYDGYGLSNYDVVVPAFITAIEGRNAEKSSLGHNRKIPLPNWTIVYSGLTNIPFINKRFEVFEISHNYLSSYTANGIQTNPNYFADPLGRDLNNNFYSKNLYGTINMIESFSLLIGVNMKIRNIF